MAERMAARPNADKQKQGSARKGAGLCTTRDLVRSLTLSYVSRGLSPSRIVDKMLDFANSQNDPSIRKVIAFQLMDKVGRMEGVDKQTITRIADCMAPIFSKLPEAARKNFQKLSNEVSAIHSFSPVSMEKMAERTRLDGPRASFAPQPRQAASIIEAATTHLGDSHVSAPLGDVSHFVAARETIFKVHEETRDLRHLRRARTVWTEMAPEPPAPVAAIRAPEDKIRPPEPGPDFFMPAFAPRAEPKDSAPEGLTPPSAQMASEVSGPDNPAPRAPEPEMPRAAEPEPARATFQGDIPAPSEQPRRESVPEPEKVQDKEGDSMTRDINPVGIPKMPSLEGEVDFSPLMADSEKGEEIIRRLMEKMQSHGKRKHHVKRGKAEKPREEPKEKPPKKAKKSKPAKVKKRKKAKAASKKKEKKAKKKMLTEKKKSEKKKKAAKKAKKKAAAKPKELKKAAKKTTKKSAAKKPSKKPAKKAPPKKSKKKAKKKAVKALLKKKK